MKTFKQNIFCGFLAILVLALALVACDNGNDTTHTHTWEWTVTNTTYPAQSTQKCTGCGETGTSRETIIGDTGPGGGKIFYVLTAGFTVTGTGSFTAHYLEAAPADMETALTWASSSFSSTNITGTETAIGTGKANTALILAEDANAPAAKACADYTNGGKTDWFLPSKDELDEMYKARSHLVISLGYFWSSSQFSNVNAWCHNFVNNVQYNNEKYHVDGVRAFRAF